MFPLNRYSVALSLVLLLLVSGCSSYYKVTEPGSGKVFYTTDVKQRGGAGAVEFQDATSGAMTTLQNSQVLEIDKKAFEAAVTPTKK